MRRLAVLVRYGNQFWAANLAMMAARTSAANAKNTSAAKATESAFHTTWAAQVQALKAELGPDAWATLMSHKAQLAGTVTDISNSNVSATDPRTGGK